MRITESGNIMESLITDRIDKVFYDDRYVIDESAYDIALYVQFRSETDNNDIMTYKILFYEDYNKSSDDMHKLVVSLMKDIDMDTCDKAVKEYLYKHQGVIFGGIIINGKVYDNPYKVWSTRIKNTRI